MALGADLEAMEAGAGTREATTTIDTSLKSTGRAPLSQFRTIPIWTREAYLLKPCSILLPARWGSYAVILRVSNVDKDIPC